LFERIIHQPLEVGCQVKLGCLDFERKAKTTIDFLEGIFALTNKDGAKPGFFDAEFIESTTATLVIEMYHVSFAMRPAMSDCSV